MEYFGSPAAGWVPESKLMKNAHGDAKNGLWKVTKEARSTILGPRRDFGLNPSEDTGGRSGRVFDAVETSADCCEQVRMKISY
jgi:hypothetical protein